MPSHSSFVKIMSSTLHLLVGRVNCEFQEEANTGSMKNFKLQTADILPISRVLKGSRYDEDIKTPVHMKRPAPHFKSIEMDKYKWRAIGQIRSTAQESHC